MRAEDLDDNPCFSYRDIASMRGVRGEVCRECFGLGAVVYARTSTWRRGGISGCAMTFDVCDECWGSGSQSHRWLDLRAAE